MVHIDEVHSEVVVDSVPGTLQRSDANDKPTEVRIEELREIVRIVLAEEFERVLRTSSVDNGWQG
ncbi:MAG: hypothetical protein LC541_01770 [Candidatus Thiodiazotropha sp.]|nr:hypothetical protein [Candidatus Thiodiazotropha sp.]MCM8921768.1 hypothetical protein [Candidatus Thiodiazotropha sp.]